ncbi:DUF192 domain-containing protein [Vampirovibrio sp.]|uniref:DUF192 domain-containing protein n=1 Tax=Vampirovibrio sp. TaxID=2717857 RepID=UPI0035940319
MGQNMGYEVINKTRNTVVASQVRKADTYFKRLVGLMGKPVIPQGFGLWIVPCQDIHSFFMRVEFDAIFLNQEGQVLHLVQRMKPWRISKFVRGGKVVLELSAGTIEQSGTQPGDELALQAISTEAF